MIMNLILKVFLTHVVPRNHTAHSQGGGMLILIDTNCSIYVSLQEIIRDSIVWLKIDKRIICQNNTVFLVCVYIPPSGSHFYNQITVIYFMIWRKT